MSGNQPIKSVSDLSLRVAEALAHLGSDLWWRGHAMASWTLVPAVFRCDRGYNYERTANRRFVKSAASRYDNCPPMNNIAAWLILMQHYGLPTRLLDWSESPLVALYFAVETNRPGDAVIYALNPVELNERQLGPRAILAPNESQMNPLFAPAFDVDKPEPDAKAGAVLVDETDPRMLAQLTALSIHTGPNPLDSLEGHETFLMRFVVPGELRETLRMELWHHGVRRSTLFPDLANLAAELSEMTFRKA